MWWRPIDYYQERRSISMNIVIGRIESLHPNSIRSIAAITACRVASYNCVTWRAWTHCGAWTHDGARGCDVYSWQSRCCGEPPATGGTGYGLSKLLSCCVLKPCYMTDTCAPHPCRNRHRTGWTYTARIWINTIISRFEGSQPDSLMLHLYVALVAQSAALTLVRGYPQVFI